MAFQEIAVIRGAGVVTLKKRPYASETPCLPLPHASIRPEGPARPGRIEFRRGRAGGIPRPASPHGIAPAGPATGGFAKRISRERRPQFLEAWTPGSRSFRHRKPRTCALIMAGIVD